MLVIPVILNGAAGRVFVVLNERSVVMAFRRRRGGFRRGRGRGRMRGRRRGRGFRLRGLRGGIRM